MPTTTITFGEVAENGPGMQKLGKMAPEGLTGEELLTAKQRFEDAGYECELINLAAAAEFKEGEFGEVPEAFLLVIRDGLRAFTDPAAFSAEQKNLIPDKKAIFRGEVKNKRARWNLCFGDEPQEPSYEEGKGRIVPFSSLKSLSAVRSGIGQVFGPKAVNLYAEGNYYYDDSCGIGFHGDAERGIVIAARDGDPMPLHYQWFLRFEPVGKRIAVMLNGGDMYAMSGYAVGTNWKKSSILTLRHAAGAKKYLTIKKD